MMPKMSRIIYALLITSVRVKKAIFFVLGNFLIFISRRNASLLLISKLVESRVTGLLDRVYLDAVPRLWLISLFSRPLVVPV